MTISGCSHPTLPENMVSLPDCFLIYRAAGILHDQVTLAGPARVLLHWCSLTRAQQLSRIP